ncbi:MAG: hypothetical protein IJL42_00130, partial [Bacteroidales bacterium]|nr:hypothetical protein [Bacteroidales bacterium]
MLQIPAAQTALVRKILRSVENNIDGRIEFADMTFVPFNGLVIKDLAIIDDNPAQGEVTLDTLFSAGTVAARFTLQGLLSQNGIQLKDVEVEHARFALVNESGEYSSNLARIFRMKPPEEEKEKKEGDVFSINKVRIKDFNFRMLDRTGKPMEKPEYGIDWGDLDLTADIEGRDLKFSGGVMSGLAQSVRVREKSGLDATLSGEASVGNGRTAITGLRLRDESSNLSLPELTLSYNGTEDFGDFVNKVRIQGELGRSTLGFKTLSYFVPSFKDNTIVADINSGRVSGPVNNLRIYNFDFKDRTSGFGGNANVSLSNVSDISNMGLNTELKDFTFTTEGLGGFL